VKTRVFVAIAVACVLNAPAAAPAAVSLTALEPVHEGVASCSGSTCHGRSVASGPVVRQNEIFTWQDRTSVAGAHSRAWMVLTQPRAKAIATRLGIGAPETAPECVSCHVEAAAPGRRAATFQVSDGVGCEACHGAAQGWLASHYTTGVRHADNVARGMTALEDPSVRAEVCLNCHFGSDKPGQFTGHRLMSAGHPRLTFELDLFSELQRHYDLTPAYARRKALAGGVKTWAVGQAKALQRSLTLFSDAKLGQQGVFPEYAFFDCHSCHRAISDDPGARPTFAFNPERPIPGGMAPYNDENMILLAAAAHAAAPQLATRFDQDVHGFHEALAQDRGSAVRAADRLAKTSQALEAAFAASPFSRAQTFAMLDEILGRALARRFTDYAGAAQAVMATDTLINALTVEGRLDKTAQARIRPHLERAYQVVADPRSFQPEAFREAIEPVSASIRMSR